MDKKKFIITISALLILFLPFFMQSCEEDTPPDNTTDQLFRPVLFVAEVTFGNNVKFTWVPIKDATYSLEVSEDSLAFSNNLQVFALDDVKEYTMGNLKFVTWYSARIKAVSKDPAIKDSEYNNIMFVTGN